MTYSSKTHLTKDEYTALAGILHLAASAVERRDRAALSRLSQEANEIVEEIDGYGDETFFGFTFGMVWSGTNDPALLVDRLGLVVNMREA